MGGDYQEGDASPEIAEFYAVIRGSYTREELHEVIVRTGVARRVAKIRGLIPWEYDGEREDTQHRTSMRDMQGFDFPDPPAWGEAA